MPSSEIVNGHKNIITKGSTDIPRKNMDMRNHAIKAGWTRHTKSIKMDDTENILNYSDGSRLHPIHFRNCSENVLPSGKI